MLYLKIKDFSSIIFSRLRKMQGKDCRGDTADPTGNRRKRGNDVLRGLKIDIAGKAIFCLIPAHAGIYDYLTGGKILSAQMLR